MPVIRRITMFKIPSQEDQNKLLEMYKTLQAKAVKDGQKYILTAEAGKTKEDPRSQGYTIAATTTFRSMEDFEFYDTKCEAHGELKQYARSIQQGMCMLYFEVDS